MKKDQKKDLPKARDATSRLEPLCSKFVILLGVGSGHGHLWTIIVREKRKWEVRTYLSLWRVVTFLMMRWQSPDQCSAQQQNPKTEGSATIVTATWPKRPQCDSPRGSAILCTETSKTNKGVVIDVKTQVGWVWQVLGWRCDATDVSEKCIESLRR